MKQLLFLMMLPCVCFAQRKATVMSPVTSKDDIAVANGPSVPMKKGSVFYEYIDSSFKKEKPDVYKAAKLWFADFFKDSKTVLQVDDKNLGELVGKGNFPFSVTYNGADMGCMCQFTVKISCRKDRYRIQIYDISTKADNEDGFTSVDGLVKTDDGFGQRVLRQVDEDISGIIQSSRRAIAEQTDTF